MVSGARTAVGVALTLLAVGPTRAQDECSSTNLEACVNHEWDIPIREFDPDELKQWHKAFYYADWERNHDSEKTRQCDNHVKTMGQLAFENARYTHANHGTPGAELPAGGWVFFMWGEDRPDLGEHTHGAYYPYTKVEDGELVEFNIIVMSWDLERDEDLLWGKLQHEVSHYGGMGDYPPPKPGAYRLEDCGEREERKERDDPDNIAGGGNGGGGGGGGGGVFDPGGSGRGNQIQLECNEEAEWGERCVDVMWSHGLWCTDSPVGWVCDEDHEREENGFYRATVCWVEFAQWIEVCQTQ